MDMLTVKVEGGWLIANQTGDTMYPGIEFGFIADENPLEHAYVEWIGLIEKPSVHDPNNPDEINIKGGLIRTLLYQQDDDEPIADVNYDGSDFAIRPDVEVRIDAGL